MPLLKLERLHLQPPGDIPTCAELVAGMVAEAERVIRADLQALLVSTQGAGPPPRARL